MAQPCETCVNYVTDLASGEDYCAADLDEDDVAAAHGGQRGCPFYEPGDEYKLVRRQN